MSLVAIVRCSEAAAVTKFTSPNGWRGLSLSQFSDPVSFLSVRVRVRDLRTAELFRTSWDTTMLLDFRLSELVEVDEVEAPAADLPDSDSVSSPSKCTFFLSSEPFPDLAPLRRIPGSIGLDSSESTGSGGGGKFGGGVLLTVNLGSELDRTREI